MLFTLLNNLPGMAYRCRNQQNWDMEFVSQGCLALTGYLPADLLEGGKVSYGELIDSRDQLQVFEQVQTALRQKQPFQLTYRISCADGTKKWVSEKGCGVFDPEGRLIALEGFVSDITEQKQAQEHSLQSLQALRQAQAETEAERQHLYSLLMQAPSFICIVGGEDHVLEFVNPLLSELLGNRLRVGQPVRDCLAGLPATAFLDNIERVYQTGETLLAKEMLFSLPATADREEAVAYHNILFEALPDAMGHTNRVLVFGNDVTEQVKARQKAEQSQARLKGILDGLPLIAWTFLPGSTDINFFNQRWYEFTGLNSEQCQDKGWMQAIHPEDRPGIELFRAEGQQRGLPRQVEHRYRRFDGAYRWHLIRLAPIRDERGQVMLWVGTATDIDDQKTAQDELERTFRELQEKNFELDQFVYKTSHDLRAPLTTILGLVNLIKEEPQEATRLQYVDWIESRVQKLDSFIRSMLAYSRNSRTQLTLQKIDWQNLLEESLSELSSLKHFDRLKVSLQLDGDVFYADPFRLKIIFSNLISNAIKYQDLGKPESYLLITVSVTPSHAKLSFTDNGVGIDQAYQEQVFDMFMRASEQSEGSGLGLYIVKQAVSVMQGSLQLESKLGKGTTFTIYFKR